MQINGIEYRAGAEVAALSDIDVGVKMDNSLLVGNNTFNQTDLPKLNKALHDTIMQRAGITTSPVTSFSTDAETQVSPLDPIQHGPRANGVALGYDTKGAETLTKPVIVIRDSSITSVNSLGSAVASSLEKAGLPQNPSVTDLQSLGSEIWK